MRAAAVKDRDVYRSCLGEHKGRNMRGSVRHAMSWVCMPAIVCPFVPVSQGPVAAQ